MRRRELMLGLVAGGVLPRLASATEKGGAMGAVTGSLAEWKSLAATKGFEPALEYLAGLDPANVTLGRTPIVGDDVYASASKYTTKAPDTTRFEAHEKFIDVQCVLVGQEVIGFLPSIEGLKVLDPYNSEKDIAFYAVPESYVSLPLAAGRFAILRPGEAHMPGLHRDGPHDVVKVVVKVRADWYAKRLS